LELILGEDEEEKDLLKDVLNLLKLFLLLLDDDDDKNGDDLGDCDGDCDLEGIFQSSNVNLRFGKFEILDEGDDDMSKIYEEHVLLIC